MQIDEKSLVGDEHMLLISYNKKCLEVNGKPIMSCWIFTYSKNPDTQWRLELTAITTVNEAANVIFSLIENKEQNAFHNLKSIDYDNIWLDSSLSELGSRKAIRERIIEMKNKYGKEPSQEGMPF